MSSARVMTKPGVRLAELLEYVSISAGMAVAASCYMMLGLLAGSYGTRDLALVIAISAGMCLLFALALGELSSRFPSAPGIRTYLRRAFGDRTSLFFTYLTLMIVPLIAAAELKVFMASILPGASVMAQALAAVVLVALLAGFNLSGRDLPRTLQTALFITLVAVSLTVSLMGLGASHAQPVQPSEASPAKLAQGVGLAFFLFVGFEWVAPMARHPHASRQLVPWSMVLAVLLLGVMYLLFGLALKNVLAPGALLVENSAPHVALGEQLLQSAGRQVMQAVSLLALLTTLNAGLMGASRLVYGLARERAFGQACSGVLARVNGQGVPVVAVAVMACTGLMAALLVIRYDGLTTVATTGAGLYTLVYGAFAAAHVRLCRQQVGPPPPFKSPVPRAVYRVLVVLSVIVGVGTLWSCFENNVLGWLAVPTLAALGWQSHRVARSKSARAAPPQAV